MTREEAIIRFERQLKAAQVVLDSGFGSNPGESDRLYRERKEMAEIALAALRGPTREQVERMRGEWVVKHDGYNEITITECSKCKDETVYEFFFEKADKNFCPTCGAPMTDEAVEITLRRLEALKDGTTD